MKNIEKAIVKFVEDRDWSQFHSPENLAKSISIESAELLECFQWSYDYNKEHVCEELADVMIYCIQMAHALNVDIEKIIYDKLDKNEQKYPVDKCKGISKKYNEL